MNFEVKPHGEIFEVVPTTEQGRSLQQYCKNQDGWGYPTLYPTLSRAEEECKRLEFALRLLGRGYAVCAAPGAV